MFSQLTPDEQAEVGRVIDAASRKPDYEYYLANYGSFQAMKAAEPTFEKYKSRNTCLAKIWYVIWGYFGILVPFVFAMPFIGGFDSALGSALGSISVLLGVAIYFAGFVGIHRFQHVKEFGQAKKVIEEVKAKMDVPRMQKLDAEFGGTPQAQRLQGQAQATLDSFLQGAQLLPA
jgi:hypothetical protein